MNDYWSLNVGNCGTQQAPVWTRDLFGTNPDGTYGPQFHLLNPPHCWTQNMSQPEKPVAPFPASMDGCVYEEDLFTNFTISQINAHNRETEGPLLLFHSAHSIHSPLETLPDAFDRFSFIDDHSDTPSKSRRAG